MQANVTTITPDIAKLWLAKNSANRKIRSATVKKYSKAIERGEWKETGDPIRFDTSGNLLDGQHRLSAVVESGLPIRTLVVEGLDSAVMPVIDTGLKRQPSDAVQFAGITRQAAIVASGLRLVLAYEAGCITDTASSDATASRQHLVDRVIQDGPVMLEDFGIKASGIYNSLGGVPSAWFAFAYLSRDTDPDCVFMESVQTGVGLGVGDPRLVLRNWIALNAPRNGKKSRYVNFEHLGTYIRCYNSWLRGEKRLKVQLYTRASKGFPTIISKR